MSFVTLHTGLSGLRAAQTAVDVTSHNIANVSTPGYTRQRVETAARLPYDSPVGQVGTGVQVEQVVRLRDSFLDARVRSTVSTFMAQDTRSTLLSRMESVLAEPDDGMTTELAELWATLDDLALDPASTAVRTTALNQIDAFAGRVRDVTSGLGLLTSETETTRDALVSEAQGLLADVAAINVRVANGPVDEPNLDLLDQRDAHLDRLSQLLGTSATTGADGQVTVELGGATLVTGATSATLAVAGGQLEVDGTPLAPGAVGGEVGGTMQVLEVDLPATRDQLDDVVEQLGAALNTAHGGGFTDAGAPGGALVTWTPGDAAATFELALTDPAQMALKGAAGTGVNDNRNAVELADVRLATRTDGATHDEGLRTAVVDLGARVAAAGRGANAAAEIANSATVARQSQHGVSLDEEMVSLVQYQRALEANSRIMTAADEMLGTIINQMGVVGR